MEMSVMASIARAERLLRTGRPSTDFVILKLLPEPSGCCCSDCWPDAWAQVNAAISPYGPVSHEGDALVERDGAGFVLESHESGPEWVLLASVLASNITIARAIIDLVVLFTKAKLGRRGRTLASLSLEARRFADGEMVSEVILRTESPPPADITEAVAAAIRKVFPGDADS